MEFFEKVHAQDLGGRSSRGPEKLVGRLDVLEAMLAYVCSPRHAYQMVFALELNLAGSECMLLLVTCIPVHV